MSRALIVVDVQNDFVEGGSLAVQGGKEVANRIADFLITSDEPYSHYIFTKDFHNAPPDTNGGHFSDEPDYKDSWPVHCVANTPGSGLVDIVADSMYRLVEQGREVIIFLKGRGKPDYSGFQGKNGNLSLPTYLNLTNVTDIDVVGIAGEHCVKATATDAVAAGYNVRVLPDLVASVGGDEATRAVVNEFN